MGLGDQRHAPAVFRPGKTRYPVHRRLGGPHGRSGRVRKISAPTGFDPRTVQPVASSYTLQIKEHEIGETCYTRRGEELEILKDRAGLGNAAANGMIIHIWILCSSDRASLGQVKIKPTRCHCNLN